MSIPVNKIVGGEIVPLTPEEIAEYTAQWEQATLDNADPEKGGRAREEEKILRRQEKLLRAYSLVMAKLNANNTANFVQSTRQERQDYPYAPDALVNWLTTTFPTKNYYDADLATKLINILS